MGKKPTLRWLAVIALLLPTPATTVKCTYETKQQNPITDAMLLSADDKAEIAETFRLQRELGDQVWPGLSRANIPVILFNESYEFLVGERNPPPPWTVVEGDAFNGKLYHRRKANEPQAFPVQVGKRWAGSLTLLDLINRRSPLKLSRDFHVALLLHEMFHAFQAGQASDRFKQATKVYSAEARYPSRDDKFAAEWDREGSLLAAALKATDKMRVRLAVREFLQVRDARRARAALSPDLLAFERELEWLEGLAKYAEIRFYELAAARAGDPRYSSYRPELSYWRWDFIRLEKQLGRQEGDLRFYLSGMAQARLLDGLGSKWKKKLMRGGVYLEELLRTSIGSGVK
ncbi:MAG: hypothetical protein AB1757_23825 [Acidobacteriota bacterium]